jgi:hypothetical protein
MNFVVPTKTGYLNPAFFSPSPAVVVSYQQNKYVRVSVDKFIDGKIKGIAELYWSGLDPTNRNFKSRVNLTNPKSKSFGAEAADGAHQGGFQGLEADGGEGKQEDSGAGVDEDPGR